VFNGTLKEFQKEGVSFLLDKGNAVCAYSMGLGKTVIVIAALEEVQAFPALIIVPNYLKYKWEAEIQRWTDTPVTVISGVKPKRLELYDSFTEGYMVINYELVLQDWKDLLRFDFVNITCDEVTRIKGYKSKTKRAIKKLKTGSKWGLTGTPIGNKPEELYSIMDWVAPSLFGRWGDFESRYIERGYFGQIEQYKNLQDLRVTASKRMLSKSQEEVADELPDVTYENIPVEFTKKQSKLYREIAFSLKYWLDMSVSSLIELGDEPPQDKESLETAMIRQRFSALRQATISPMLLGYSDTKYVGSLSSSFDDIGPKIPAVLSLIEEASAKVVVFSFYRGVVEYLGRSLDALGVPYTTLWGGLGPEEPYRRASEFQKSKTKKVFLTTDAGEKGIDLQSAKYLINVDIPMSWEKFDQRAGRIKRLGSSHDNVFIYNIYVRESFETRQLSSLDAKRRLAYAIQGYSEEDTVVPTEMSLRDFLGSTL
jgi:SNF2 family DNA or RNA helicase